MSDRVRTRDGDWYVATKPADWASAIAACQTQVQAREARMREWEREHHPGCYPDAAYWGAYRAEKALLPVDYPMPYDHVMFGR